MTTLTGFAFNTADGAAKMVADIYDLARQQLITVEDIAVVTWPQGKKKPKTTHLGHSTGERALDGAFWGMLFGLIFLNPFFGMAVGAGIGALAGHFGNYGIDRKFIQQTRNKVTEGTSALFLITSQVERDKVISEIQYSGLKFDLFYTNLSEEQEKQLKEDFAA